MTMTQKMSLALVACAALLSALPAQADEALKAAIASPQRTPAFAARDAARHPYETLSFFGIKPNQTVVELSPGGGGYFPSPCKRSARFKAVALTLTRT